MVEPLQFIILVHGGSQSYTGSFWKVSIVLPSRGLGKYNWRGYIVQVTNIDFPKKHKVLFKSCNMAAYTWIQFDAAHFVALSHEVHSTLTVSSDAVMNKRMIKNFILQTPCLSLQWLLCLAFELPIACFQMWLNFVS